MYIWLQYLYRKHSEAEVPEFDHNKHKPPRRQIKQSNQLSLPHQDDCKTRMDIQ